MSNYNVLSGPCAIGNIQNDGNDLAEAIRNNDVAKTGTASTVIATLTGGLSPAGMLIKSIFKSAREWELRWTGHTYELTGDVDGVGRPTNVSMTTLVASSESFDATTKVFDDYATAKGNGEIPREVTEEAFQIAVARQIVNPSKNAPEAVKRSAKRLKDLFEKRKTAYETATGKTFRENFLPTYVTEKLLSQEGRQFFKSIGKEKVWLALYKNQRDINSLEMKETYIDDVEVIKALDSNINIDLLIEKGFLSGDVAGNYARFFRQMDRNAALFKIYGTSNRAKIIDDAINTFTDEANALKEKLTKDVDNGSLTSDEFSTKVKEVNKQLESDTNNVKALVAIGDDQLGAVNDPFSLLMFPLALLRGLLYIGTNINLGLTSLPDIATIIAAKITGHTTKSIQDIGFNVAKISKADAEALAVSGYSTRAKLHQLMNEFNLTKSPNMRQKIIDKMAYLSGLAYRKLGGGFIDDWSSIGAFNVVTQRLLKGLDDFEKGVNVAQAIKDLSKIGVAKEEIPTILAQIKKHGKLVGDTLNPEFVAWDGDIGRNLATKMLSESRIYKVIPDQAFSPTMFQGPIAKQFASLTGYAYSATILKTSGRAQSQSYTANAMFLLAELQMAMAVNAYKLTASGNGHLITDHPDRFLYISIATSGIFGMFGSVVDVAKFVSGQNVAGTVGGALFPLLGQVDKSMAGIRYLSGEGTVRDLDKLLSLAPPLKALALGDLLRKMAAEKIDNAVYDRSKPSTLYINESKPEPKDN